MCVCVCVCVCDQSASHPDRQIDIHVDRQTDRKIDRYFNEYFIALDSDNIMCYVFNFYITVCTMVFVSPVVNEKQHSVDIDRFGSIVTAYLLELYHSVSLVKIMKSSVILMNE